MIRKGISLAKKMVTRFVAYLWRERERDSCRFLGYLAGLLIVVHITGYLFGVPIILNAYILA